MTSDRETSADGDEPSAPEPVIRRVESTTEPFDPALQRELDRGEFAGEEAIEGEIVRTGEWKPGTAIELAVWVPMPVGEVESTVDASEALTFTESLAVPVPDAPLSSSKFGRLLTDHGYSRSQANHLIGDPVLCSYTSEGWEIVDPAPESVRESAELFQPSSDREPASAGANETAREVPDAPSRRSSGTRTPRKPQRRRREYRHLGGTLIGGGLLLGGMLQVPVLLDWAVVVETTLFEPVSLVGYTVVFLSLLVGSGFFAVVSLISDDTE